MRGCFDSFLGNPRAFIVPNPESWLRQEIEEKTIWQNEKRTGKSATEEESLTTNEQNGTENTV